MANTHASARLALIRQSKDVHLIVPPRRRDAGLRDYAARQESFAAHDGDVLLSVHRIRNGAVVDRPAERRLPEDLSVGGVERAKLAVEIAPEHEIAGRRQHRAVARCASFMYVLNFSGLHVDLRETAEFLRLRPFARDAAAFGRD